MTAKSAPDALTLEQKPRVMLDIFLPGRTAMNTFNQPSVVDVDDLSTLIERHGEATFVGKAVVDVDDKMYPLILDGRGNLCIAKVVTCARKGCERGHAFFFHQGGGGWAYGYDYDGAYQYDRRNQEWVCEDHAA